MGTTLLVVLGGLSGFDMAGGLVSLVVAVNLNEESPLLREVFGLGRKEFGIFARRAMVDQAREGLCYQ